MFGLGASEIVVILALALIVFGPQKLPELAKQLARLVGDLRRAADDVKQNFDEATRDPPPAPPPVAVQALLNASQQAAATKAAVFDKTASTGATLPHQSVPGAADAVPKAAPADAAVPPAIPTSAPAGTVSAGDKHPGLDTGPAGPSPSSGVGHG